MDDRRRHNRQHTELHLEVFELHSGERLGRVVDLSDDGFMLFGNRPQQADSVLECLLVSEHAIEGVSEVKLGVDCLWSRPGADGEHCWAGFHIIDLAEDQAAALQVLLEHL